MKFIDVKKSSVWISLVIAVSILFAGVMGYLNHKATQEEALIFQLKQIRMVIQASVKLNGQIPESLEALVETPLPMSVQIEWKMDRDPTGRLLDPFGHPYAYDPLRGWVSSTSAGYESW